MLVLQQIKVLPPGSKFTIKDEGRTELQGFISDADGSIGFLTAYESDKYFGYDVLFRMNIRKLPFPRLRLPLRLYHIAVSVL